MKHPKKWLGLCPMALAVCVLAGGIAAAGQTVSFPDCASSISLEMATDKAKITGFKCYIGKYLKKDVLWYEVALKNVSDKPARFLIRILQDEGPGFTGLIPQTGKPKKFPLLAPGKESVNKYPMNTCFQTPKKLTVAVEETVE